MAREKACVCRKVVSPYLSDDELCAVAHVTRILCGLGEKDTFDPVRALELIPFITEFSLGSKDRYGAPELQADAVAVYMFVLGDDDDAYSIAEKVKSKPAYWVIVLCVALITYIALLHEQHSKEDKIKIAA